jgi:Protein of unknown function (DUF3810)
MQFNMDALIFRVFLAGMPIRRKVTWVCLIVLAVVIKVLSWWPMAVERYYSRGFYPFISRVQRLLFGWIPFSMGDILYLTAGIILLYRLIRLVRRLVRREAGKGWWIVLLRQTVFVLLWVYVLFNGLWGLNYNRLGIAEQLQLKVRPYSTVELGTLTNIIIGQLNQLDSTSRLHRDDLTHTRLLRTGAVLAYDSLAASDPQFAYHTTSVKSSLFSYPGLYIGFAGYYNPFTGEAQVDMLNPSYTLPYTTCHEMGHQLGYAKENEANFMGFLAARSSPDPAFRYSVYLDLYIYAVRELYVRDSTLAKSFRAKLNPGVRQDLRELQQFNRRYANPLNPVIWKLYGGYLRANRQPHGIVTYSEVTAWLIAYGKEYGRDALKGKAF